MHCLCHGGALDEQILRLKFGFQFDHDFMQKTNETFFAHSVFWTASPVTSNEYFQIFMSIRANSIFYFTIFVDFNQL